MPGRARRELVLLNEQNIAHPELREVVRDRTADDAAADDDDSCACRQDLGHRVLLAMVFGQVGWDGYSVLVKLPSPPSSP